MHGEGLGEGPEGPSRLLLPLTLPRTRLPSLGAQDAGIGRYSPHLLADYLILAAAPPSAKSKALLHYSSPFRGAAGAGTAAAAGAVGDPAGGATAAAAAEEDVLAGEPLCPGVASALRQGAYALYGTCSAAEVRPAGDPP